MNPNIIPKKKLEKKLYDGNNKKVSNKIWKGKNNDSFQKEEWYWKIEGSNERNKIIKKHLSNYDNLPCDVEPCDENNYSDLQKSK